MEKYKLQTEEIVREELQLDLLSILNLTIDKSFKCIEKVLFSTNVHKLEIEITAYREYKVISLIYTNIPKLDKGSTILKVNTKMIPARQCAKLVEETIELLRKMEL